MSNEIILITICLLIVFSYLFIFFRKYIKLKLRISYLQGKEDAIHELNEINIKENDKG